ncbi:MAG: 30S ribosomal protein S5 [Parcubacteria group bacterium]|nr:MAG: 30S ribosomal protein S5 [Parcubacteria group bacterium]
MEEKNTTEVKAVVKPDVVRSAHRHPSARPRRSGGKGSFSRPVEEFEQKIVDLARVTRVMAGGKRMKFRACMVVGDKKGRVGVGIAKGVDVSMAISKAVTKAKKHLIHVPIIEGTVPHPVTIKEGAAFVMIKPARAGSGIKAGGVMRIVLELAGVKDAAAKILGTSNKLNNAEATIIALKSFVPRAFNRAKNFKSRGPKATITSGPKDQVEIKK